MSGDDALRLDRVLCELQRRQNYDVAAVFAMSFALRVVDEILLPHYVDKTSREELAGLENASQAAHRWVNSECSRSEKRRAEVAAALLLRGTLAGLFGAVNVNDPKRAARVALRLASEAGHRSAALDIFGRLRGPPLPPSAVEAGLGRSPVRKDPPEQVVEVGPVVRVPDMAEFVDHHVVDAVKRGDHQIRVEENAP